MAKRVNLSGKTIFEVICLMPFFLSSLSAIFHTTKTGFPCQGKTCFTGTNKIKFTFLAG